MASERIIKVTDGGELRLYEDKENGRNFVALKAAPDIVSDYTISLPAGQGTDGEVLTADGAGGSRWGNSAATLNTAYHTGAQISADSGQIEILKTDDTNTFRIYKSATGAGAIFDIENAGTGNDFTADNWSMSQAGVLIAKNILTPGPDPWYDVKANGATGDGVTDDTAAIQAILDAAATNGGSVFFPTGTYLIEGRLFYRSLKPIKIFGTGLSSKILWDPPAEVTLTVSAATNAIPVEITTTGSHGYSTGDWVIVQGVTGNTGANGSWVVTYVSATKFTLDGSEGSGDYVSGGTASGIKEYALLGIAGTETANAYHCQGALIRDLHFDFGGSRAAGWAEFHRGLNLFNTDNIEVCSCYLKGCRGETIGLGNFGLPGTPGNQASVHENTIEDFAQDGVNPNVLNASVCRNIFITGDTGIEAGRSSFTASDNIFDDMEGCAIKIASCVGFNVNNNRMNNCLNDGSGLSSAVGSIYVMEQGGSTLSSDGVISGNVIINPTRHAFQVGIVVSSSSVIPERIQVSGNVIYGPQQGIYVSNAKWISIYGNYIYPLGGSTGIAIDVGTTYCGAVNNTVFGTWTNVAVEVNSAASNYQVGNKTDAVGYSIYQPANSNALNITKRVTGAGALVNLANSGTGYDISGTSASWYVTKAGAATLPTLASTTVGADTLTLSGGIIVTPKAKTIASDAITIDATYGTITLTPQSGNTDDLATITGGTDGQIIILRCHADADAITVTQTDNISMSGNHTLDDRKDRLTLQYDGDITKWCEVSFVSNA